MKESVCVIGLGYVGLPLAFLLASKHRVVGYDRDAERTRRLREGAVVTDGSPAPGPEAVENLSFADDIDAVRDCGIFIITVPTPLSPEGEPDLSLLGDACRQVGGALERGGLVIVESTVYPGVTEEFCAPILAEASGLEFNRDFTCGYSPERLSPGSNHRFISDIVKVTAGSTPEAARRVDALYRSVVGAGTFRAESIRVAEAAKALENTQRNINIAIMNEAALIFDALGLDSRAVFAAAATKWNFLKFEPGLVGGHCIGVDPYYLSHKAMASGYHPELILAARQVNDAMGTRVADKTLRLMEGRGVAARGARVLILGFAFKENCPDTRNSQVIDIARGLEAAGCAVEICDPVADGGQAHREYGVDLETDLDQCLSRSPEVVVFAVAHDVFKDMPEAKLGQAALVVDVKAIAPRADWRL